MIISPSPFIHTNFIGTYTARKRDIRFHHVSADGPSIAEDLPGHGEGPVWKIHCWNQIQPIIPLFIYRPITQTWSLRLSSFGVMKTLNFKLLNNYRTSYQHIGNSSHVKSPICLELGKNFMVRNQSVRDGSPTQLVFGLFHQRAVSVKHASRLLTVKERDPTRKCLSSSWNRSAKDAYDRVTDRAGHDLRYAIDSTNCVRRIGLGTQFNGRKTSSGIQTTKTGGRGWKKKLKPYARTQVVIK